MRDPISNRAHKSRTSLASRILDGLSSHKKSYSVLESKFDKTPFHIAPRQGEWPNGSICTAQEEDSTQVNQLRTHSTVEALPIEATTHSYLKHAEQQDLDTDDGFIYEDNDEGNDSQSSQALKVKLAAG